MNFLAPLLLFGATAASIPVLLHFFFRSRYRTVPWAAMEFLLTSIEQTSRRLKIQELILLLVRMTVIALLALALSRLLAPSLFYTLLAVFIYLIPILITMAVAALIVFLAERFLNVSRLLTMTVLAVLVAILVTTNLAAVVTLFSLAAVVPSQVAGGGSGEAVDAVFVFDTSYSMAARDGEETRIDKAKAAALQVIDSLPPYSTVQIVTCADRAELLGPRVPANLDQAKHLIENLKTTHQSTDFLAGAQEGLKVLKRRQLSNKELYLFSDMQKSGWEAQSSALKETMRDIKQQAAVYMVRCGTRKVNNVAISGITPQAGIPRPGERVGFAVLVKNTSDKPAKDLEVSLLLDGNDKTKETRSIKEIPAGDTRAVTLTTKITEKGMHVVTAIVKQDDLPADNRFDRVIQVRDAVRVLVIDGSPNKEDAKKASSYHFLHALMPVQDQHKSKHQIQSTVMTARSVVPGLLKDFDLCALINVSVKPDLKKRVQHLSPEFLDDLNRFVREGHGLIIFSGENVDIASYNKVFVKRLGLLPYELTKLAERKPEDPLFLNRKTAELPVFRPFKEDKVHELLDFVKVWKTFEMKEPSFSRKLKSTKPKTEVAKNKGAKDKKKIGKGSNSTTVALRYGNGKAAILSHSVDGGEVLFFTTSAHPGSKPDSLDPSWTDMQVFPSVHFPLIVQLSLKHLVHQQTQNHNATAGSAIAWFAPPKKADHSFVMYEPDAKKRRLGLPTMQADRPMVVLNDLPRAGVYRLLSVDQSQQSRDIVNDPVLVEQIRKGIAKVGTPFAVTPDLNESADLESMTNEQIDRLLGFSVIHASAASDPSSYSNLDRSNREWTWWILLAVLCITVGEGALAWFCGRPI